MAAGLTPCRRWHFGLVIRFRDGEKDLVGEIVRDRTLTEDQKQTLIRIYLSFAHENEGKLVAHSGNSVKDEVASG